MKNTNVFHKLTVQVDHVVEIRLCFATWNKIKLIAAMRNCSYSWVVRYALFRTIKRKNPHHFLEGGSSSAMRVKFNELHESANKKKFGSENKHRHRLCLYGDDELYLRIIAARMNCSMTHLVRMALENYLEKMYIRTSPLRHFGPPLGRFARSAWYWMGIKLFKVMEFPTMGKDPTYCSFRRYKKTDYW